MFLMTTPTFFEHKKLNFITLRDLIALVTEKIGDSAEVVEWDGLRPDENGKLHVLINRIGEGHGA